MKPRLLAIVAILACFVWAPDACAQLDCSIRPTKRDIENNYRGDIRYATAYKELQSCELVFVGEVVDVRISDPRSAGVLGDSGHVIYRLRVEQAWKGTDTPMIDVVESRVGATIGMQKGQRWLIYARQVDQNAYPTIRYCSGTRRVEV